MTIVKHELKQGRITLLIWTSCISYLLAICIFLYPEMKDQLNGLSELFSSMGILSSAFSLDELNFGMLAGFYALECGNILGLGGAFYASLSAVSILSKEEKDKTAEFLLTHPMSRQRVLTEKLLALLIQISVMNIVIYLISIASMAVTSQEIPWKEINLLHLAYFIMQIELMGLCFGISAFMRRGSVGIGLGVAMLMFFLNLISKIAKSAEFLRYITSFGYCNGADIITKGKLDYPLLSLGLGLGILGIALAYVKYINKDIH